jgi:hypothetical protein
MTSLIAAEFRGGKQSSQSAPSFTFSFDIPEAGGEASSSSSKKKKKKKRKPKKKGAIEAEGGTEDANEDANDDEGENGSGEDENADQEDQRDPTSCSYLESKLQSVLRISDHPAPRGSNNKQQTSTPSPGTRGKQKKSAIAVAADAELDFLNEAIQAAADEREKLAQQQQQQQSILLKLKDKTEKQTGSSVSDRTKFLSYKDEELTEDARFRLQYGKGINVVAIGRPKVRSAQWTSSGEQITETTTAAIQPISHSSPFSFGFEPLARNI